MTNKKHESRMKMEKEIEQYRMPTMQSYKVSQEPVRLNA